MSKLAPLPAIRRFSLRRPNPRRIAAACALAALAGCQEVPFGLGEPAGDRTICSPPPPVRDAAPADSYQQAVARDECIHNWAYRLARSRDGADAVVGAVLGACRSSINRSATLLAEGDEEAERFYLEQMEAAARERALFRVVQARAGRCSAEPRAAEPANPASSGPVPGPAGGPRAAPRSEGVAPANAAATPAPPPADGAANSAR